MSGHLGRDLPVLAGVALGTSLVWRRLRRDGVPGGSRRWASTNHAGDPVTLLEGPALVIGTVAGTAAAGWLLPAHRVRLQAAALVVLACGAAGAVDDLRTDTSPKGLSGHLAALTRGQVTTGVVKVLLLASAGLAASCVGDKAEGRLEPLGTLAGGAVVAGAANLANLFDLRPGRSLKVGLACAIPLVVTGSGTPVAAAAAGAAIAVLPDDLAGRSMLGDTGANPWGAVLGLAAVQRQDRGARCATLAVVTVLTLLSELVSFTRVIEATPVLRQLDALGRPRR